MMKTSGFFINMMKTSGFFINMMKRTWFFVRGVLILSGETFKETRSLKLPTLILLGGLLMLLLGMRLPTSMGPVFFYGGTTVLLTLTGMAYGAWILRADRSSGFDQLLGSKPIYFSSYFLGRFFGLASRLTLIALIVFLACSLIYSATASDSRFDKIKKAQRFCYGDQALSLQSALILKPQDEGARWTFACTEEEKIGLRFRFRPKYPRSSGLRVRIGLSLRVTRNGSELFTKVFEIRNRKSLDTAFVSQGPGAYKVELKITEGQNYLEVNGQGCSWIQGNENPVITLGMAALAFLPALYLSLALALTFSCFVSTPTALFATLVLALTTTMAPFLQTEIRFILKEQEAPGIKAQIAQVASKALRVLPDSEAGGCAGPLSKMERPIQSDILLPWVEAGPRLLILLILGSCLLRRQGS